MEHCSKCGVELTQDNWYPSRRRYQGNICKECHLKESYRRHHNLRLRVIALLGGKCVSCGESDWRCLQIDHVNDHGTRDRSKFSTWTFQKYVLEEIEAGSKQYQLLCANCNWKKRYEKRERDIALCSRAQHIGMMLSAAKGVIKDGKVIASRTEEEIFKALNMDFVEPEKREE